MGDYPAAAVTVAEVFDKIVIRLGILAHAPGVWLRGHADVPAPEVGRGGGVAHRAAVVLGHEHFGVAFLEENVFQVGHVALEILLAKAALVEAVAAFIHDTLAGVGRFLVVDVGVGRVETKQTVQLDSAELGDAASIEGGAGGQCQGGPAACTCHVGIGRKDVGNLEALVDDEVVALLFAVARRIDLFLGGVDRGFLQDKRDAAITLYHREIVESAEETGLGLAHRCRRQRGRLDCLDEVVELAVEVVAVAPPAHRVGVGLETVELDVGVAGLGAALAVFGLVGHCHHVDRTFTLGGDAHVDGPCAWII